MASAPSSGGRSNPWWTIEPRVAGRVGALRGRGGPAQSGCRAESSSEAPSPYVEHESKSAGMGSKILHAIKVHLLSSPEAASWAQSVSMVRLRAKTLAIGLTCNYF